MRHAGRNCHSIFVAQSACCRRRPGSASDALIVLSNLLDLQVIQHLPRLVHLDLEQLNSLEQVGLAV